jgi:hypothetical protein
MISKFNISKKKIDSLIVERYLEQSLRQDIDQNYCDGADKLFQFTLTNITKQPQTITLFNGQQLSPPTNNIQNNFGLNSITGTGNLNSLNAPFYEENKLTYTLQIGSRIVTYDLNGSQVNVFNIAPDGVSSGIATALDTKRGRIAVLEATGFFVFDINNGFSLLYSVVTSGILNRDIIYSPQTDRYYIVGIASPNPIGIFNAVDGSLVTNITPTVGAGGAFAGQYLNILNGKVYFPDDRENNSRIYVLEEDSLTGSFITTTNTRNKAVAVNSDDNVIAAIDGKSPTAVSVINSQNDTEIANYTGLLSGGASFSIYYNNWTKQYLMGVTGRIYIYDVFFNEEQFFTGTGSTISLAKRPFGDIFAINTGSNINTLSPNITQGGIQITDINKYNYFNNTLMKDVKKLYCSNVIVSEEIQINNPLQFSQKDANGQEFTMNYFPNTKVSIWQNRGKRALVKTQWVVLNSEVTINYTLNPLTNVTFLLHYDDWKMSDFVANRYNVRYNFSKKPVIPKQDDEKNNNFVNENSPLKSAVVNYKRVRGVIPIIGYKKELVFVPVGDLNFGLAIPDNRPFNRG